MPRQFPNITDQYAELENRIRFKVLRQHADSPVPQKLRAILSAAISELQKMSILDEVIYVVLNHPPISLKTGKRHFIAALNKIDEQTKDFLRERALTHPAEASSENCEVILLDSARHNVSAEAIEQLWVKQWNEYWELTEESLRQASHTWNQLLFKKGARPEPMGICWRPHDSRKARGVPYYNLSPSMAATIGLGCLGKPDYIRHLLSLSRDESSVKQTEGTDFRELHPLRELFDRIDQDGAAQRTLHRVAWKVFHLIRSYGVWGGTSFLSIPLVIGAPQLNHTAVLSICTKAPLTSAGYNHWVRIAGILLRPVLEEEMFRAVEQLDFAAAAYGIGHSLKSRIMAVITSINEMRELLPQLPEGEGRQKLEEHATKAHSSCCVLGGFGHILDIKTRCITSGQRETAFLGKTEWNTNQSEYDLVARLQEISKRPLPPGGNPKVQIVLDDACVKMSIGLWITNPETGLTSRPSDLFYDDIFQELLINAARHANTSFDNPVAVRLEATQITTHAGPPMRAVSLSNICSAYAGTTLLDLPMDKWFLYDGTSQGTEGGIPIITGFLQLTNLGKGLYVHRSWEGGSFTYKVAVPLTGLRLGDFQPSGLHL